MCIQNVDRCTTFTSDVKSTHVLDNGQRWMELQGPCDSIITFCRHSGTKCTPTTACRLKPMTCIISGCLQHANLDLRLPPATGLHRYTTRALKCITSNQHLHIGKMMKRVRVGTSTLLLDIGTEVMNFAAPVIDPTPSHLPHLIQTRPVLNCPYTTLINHF